MCIYTLKKTKIEKKMKNSSGGGGGGGGAQLHRVSGVKDTAKNNKD